MLRLKTSTASGRRDRVSLAQCGCTRTHALCASHSSAIRYPCISTQKLMEACSVLPTWAQAYAQKEIRDWLLACMHARMRAAGMTAPSFSRSYVRVHVCLSADWGHTTSYVSTNPLVGAYIFTLCLFWGLILEPIHSWFSCCRDSGDRWKYPTNN
jgi:hypothetical protein